MKERIIKPTLRVWNKEKIRMKEILRGKIGWEMRRPQRVKRKLERKWEKEKRSVRKIKKGKCKKRDRKKDKSKERERKR